MVPQKGVVDTLSEVFSVIFIAVMYSWEIGLASFAGKFKVTRYALVSGADPFLSESYNTTQVEWEFEHPQCFVTCFGMAIPTKSLGEVAGMYLVVFFLRIFFLITERAMVLRIQDRLKEEVEDREERKQ